MQSAGSARLVSASDNIKIWGADHMNILRQYGSESISAGSNFKDVAWSVDNSKLAGVSNGCGIILYDINEGVKTGVRELPKSEEQTCLCFGKNKDELYSGGATGDINLWNYSTGRLDKTFESGQKSPIRCIHRMGDGRVASACTSGDIVIWLTDSCSPQVTLNSKSKSIRGLENSAWESSLLGTATDDGIVCIWDIDKQTIIRNFANHDAPSMDLSFSPMNRLLLASCGLDKKIIFYDIKGNNIVKTIVCPQPVTAVCMLSDGVHVCAGSSMGNIFKYDLRQSDGPINSINAHSTSVQRLVLETQKERIRKEKRSSSKSRQESTSSSTKRKPSRTRDETKPATHHTEPMTRESQDTTKNRRSWSKVPEVELPPDDVKPINGVDHPTPAKSITNRKSQIERSFGLQTPLNRSNASSRRDTLGSYCEGVFSPVANISASPQEDVLRSQNRSKPQRTSRGHTSQSLHPHINFNFNVPPPEQKVNGSSAQTRESYVNGLETPLFKEPRQQETARGSFTGTDSLLPSGTQMFSSTPTNPATNSASSLSPDSEATGSSERLRSRHEETSLNTMVNENHVGGFLVGDQQPNFNPFSYQLDFLRNTVRDLVEDHEDNMRDEIRHLHMQFIKMFVELNGRITQLAEQCSVNPMLLQEIERLRNENDRLRRKF